MTEENRRENVGLELERARAALRSARILLEHGEYPDSVSRAYYGMLHGARAVLLTEGLEPKTHGGVAHHLNLRFVRAGAFPVRQARRFTRLQAEREAADYDRTAVFTREEAADTLAAAEEFFKVCEELVTRRGYA